MDNRLRNKVLQANIDVHRQEARDYELRHGEIYNLYEQRRIIDGLRTSTYSLKRNVSVLDVGAGTGNIPSKLSKLGFSNIVCVDVSREMLHGLEKKGVVPQKNLICASIEDYLASNKSKFDLITVSSTLHHLVDYEFVLIELYGRLNKGGLIFITHEPRKLELTAMRQRGVTLLRKIDYFLHASRYLINCLLGRIRFLRIEYSLSDYHIDDRALDPHKIIALVKPDRYSLSFYSLGKFSFSAFLMSRLVQDNFELILFKD